MANTKHIEVFRGGGKIRRWYWHVRAANGKITNPSQGYATKWSAKRAAKGSFPDLEIEAK